MYEVPKGSTTESEQLILRKLRVWIAALAMACLCVGFVVGTMLSARSTVAQNEAALGRAPEALSASFAEIARRVEPAVVNIDTISMTEIPEEESEENERQSKSQKNPLLDMFQNPNRNLPERGVGSGFIVDQRGFILTNQHVVEGASRITVRLQSGEEMRGTVVGIDEETDVAVIKVSTPHKLPIVKLGDSNGVSVGDWVLAIGSPFGLDQTVTAGIISTKERRTPNSSNFQRFLQTDAAINRGNSGGPLVNMRGEVIGINSQIATTNGDYNGIGFALPANEASFVYQQLVSTGRVRRGYLGVTLLPVKREFARVFGLPETRGVVVSDVRDNQSPAGKAGIISNDIIVEFNGQPVSSPNELITKVASTPVGNTVQLTYLRDNNGKLDRKVATVTVGERPSTSSLLGRERRTSSPADSPATSNSGRLKLGLTLSELTPQLARERNLTGLQGLLIKDVDPSGIASDAGLRSGWVILKINRLHVTSLLQFEKVVTALKSGDAIVLNIAYYDGVRIAQDVVQFTYQ
jgi:serine protease Do